MKTFSIPLRLINLQDDGYHLLVEIVIFKKKHFAVLDTGASRSVFDQSTIEAHLSQSLVESDEINAATLFTTTSTLQAQIPELRIGKLKITNYHTVAFDLQSVNDTYQQFNFPAIAGIIGGDILLKYQAVINYKTLELSLCK